MELTPRQQQVQIELAGDAQYSMLFGGSRSGKTFLYVRNVILRALKAPASRHAIFRFRFNAIKASIIADTFPKVMRLCFPGVAYELNRTDWFATLPNESQIWFGGLDDAQRTEKILGQEFSTLYFNECSQIPWSSVQMAYTRLAQHSMQRIDGRGPVALRTRAFHDCNPPSKAHWSYKLFVEKRDPESGQLLKSPNNYVAMQINPRDNSQNLAADYLQTLEDMSPRMRARFLEGVFADANPHQLFNDDVIHANRIMDGKTPDMVRLVVAVDPSGSGDVDNADNDAIGIIVAGLGTDGFAYVIEDCTVKAGPGTWGKVATNAYDRHAASCIVGEINYGGAMVQHVIQTARPRTTYKSVTASRGKVVRAEPIAALYDQGKVRHVGYFPELEDELAQFSTFGYVGEKSPNRADALVWALTELFPGLVKPAAKPSGLSNRPSFGQHGHTAGLGWMRG